MWMLRDSYAIFTCRNKLFETNWKTWAWVSKDHNSQRNWKITIAQKAPLILMFTILKTLIQIEYEQGIDY